MSHGPGETLGGRYRILSPIGQGGMGAVFLAEDLKLKGKKWAVKAIPIPPGEETRLALEAEMLASLQHPRLPHIVDYFVPDGHGIAYMVMDYVQGPTLQDAFERAGRQFDWQAVVRIGIQLCELLHYLHTYKPRPIVYRDLKPSNVMLDESGGLRLIDFGIARHFKLGQHADTIRIGTIGFAAPEQIAGEQTDPRSDLYGLGALLYYLLTQGGMYYLNAAALSDSRPDLPAGLTSTVQRLLEDDARLRIQTAAEARERLVAVDVSGVSNTAHLLTFPSPEPSRSEPGAAERQRLVVAGSLYPGAGSTFLAVSLARMLHTCGVDNALIEHPTNEPDLYMLLYGDKKAPKGYSFEPDVILQDEIDPTPSNRVVWSEGRTVWVPGNPEGLRSDWTIAATFKLLHRARRTVTIWDVSTSWEDPSVAELCQAADLILVVADASPSKLSRPSSRTRLESLTKAEWIANREVRSGQSEWHAALPNPPKCIVPEIPRDAVLKSMWKGALLQDDPLFRDTIFDSLQPVLRELVPGSIQPLLSSEKKTNKWRRFFG